jgi:NhaP-type Na+/H+ and K+/H+ antiporter
VIESLEWALLVVAGLVLLSVLLSPLAIRLGAPILLIFLGIGMLVGQNGPGGYAFDDFELAYHVGSIALAMILFTGGLGTRVHAIRVCWGPALMLATLGVVITAAVVGLSIWLLGVSLLVALLLGLLVIPQQFRGEVLHAAGIAFILIFIARPLAVAICLAPFRFSLNERLFIAWVGLRSGAHLSRDHPGHEPRPSRRKLLQCRLHGGDRLARSAGLVHPMAGAAARSGGSAQGGRVGIAQAPAMTKPTTRKAQASTILLKP